MPNIRAAAKRQRADRARHHRNLYFSSELKTLERNFQKTVREGSPSEVQTLYRLLTKKVDQAAGKKILHRNTASRTKARLARLSASKLQK